MMLNIAFGHLQTLGNDNYIRNSSPTNIYLFKLNIKNTKKSVKDVQIFMLLGVSTEIMLNFDRHISRICSKADSKINAW